MCHSNKISQNHGNLFISFPSGWMMTGPRMATKHKSKDPLFMFMFTLFWAGTL